MKTSTISLLCAASLLAACATTPDPAPAIAASKVQHDACNAAELKGQLAEADRKSVV